MTEKQRENARKMGLKCRGRIYRKETLQKMSLAHQGLLPSDLSRKKMSESKRKNWQDVNYREKILSAQLKGRFKRPTSLERQFIEFIQQNNLPYKYTGDGSFLIGWKNPDFVNVNGEKICVEVRAKAATKYWNNIEPEIYVNQRQEHFAKYGWKCIVILANNRSREGKKWTFDKSGEEIIKELNSCGGKD